MAIQRLYRSRASDNYMLVVFSRNVSIYNTNMKCGLKPLFFSLLFLILSTARDVECCINYIRHTVLNYYLYMLNFVFCQCSRACGGGIQTRTIFCVDKLSGETVSNSHCMIIHKPNAIDRCDTQSCSEWETSDWSTVSL